jgi:hypothetical protein
VIDPPTVVAIRSEALLTVNCRKLDHQLSGDPSAVLHINTLRLRPLANLDGVWPLLPLRPLWAGRALPPTRRLVPRFVQPEADGAFSVTAPRSSMNKLCIFWATSKFIPLTDSIRQRGQSKPD